MQGVTFVAKLIKSAFEILLELSGITGVVMLTHRLLGLSRLDVSILFSVATVVIGIVIYKIDWENTAASAARTFHSQGIGRYWAFRIWAAPPQPHMRVTGSPDPLS